MQSLDMKKRVAQEIMALMDQKDGERLKKHPKFAAAKIEVEEPSLEEVSLDGEESELSPEMIKKLLEMVNGE